MKIKNIETVKEITNKYTRRSNSLLIQNNRNENVKIRFLNFKKSNLFLSDIPRVSVDWQSEISGQYRTVDRLQDDHWIKESWIPSRLIFFWYWTFTFLDINLIPRTYVLSWAVATGWWRVGTGLLDYGLKWVRLTPNGQTETFQIRFQNKTMLARQAKIYLNKIGKIPGFVLFWDNLAHFGPKSGMLDLQDLLFVCFPFKCRHSHTLHVALYIHSYYY